MNNLIQSLLNLFRGIWKAPFGKEITVFILSLFPIIELRGGLIAAALLKIEPLPSYLICILGNIVPIPFILFLIQGILNAMRKTKLFHKIVLWLDHKVEQKKGQIERYGFWGLVLFVGIPLPGTGAWTGGLIAAVLNMDKKKAFLALTLGVILAGILMMIFSYGFLSNFL